MMLIDSQAETRAKVKELETKSEGEHQDEFMKQVNMGKSPVSLIFEQASALEADASAGEVNKELVEKLIDVSPVALAYLLQNPKFRGSVRQVIADVVDYLTSDANTIEMEHISEEGNMSSL